MILPIVKPGKERQNEAGKYRPISLINIGEHTRETINRQNKPPHIFQKILNENQY
jgi:hypothetical protein